MVSLTTMQSTFIENDQNDAAEYQLKFRTRSASVISNGDDVSCSSSIGGYSADEEDEESLILWEPSALLIDLTTNDSKRNYDQNDASSTCEQGGKRRKLAQNNFAAFNAAVDLAAAGLSYPVINTSSSRMAPGIDLSTVRLVSAKSYQSSPFLHSAATTSSSNQYDLLAPDLFAQSAPAYQLSVPMPSTVALPCDWTSCSDRGDATLIGTGSFSKCIRIPEEPIVKRRALYDDSNGSCIPTQVIA